MYIATGKALWKKMVEEIRDFNFFTLDAEPGQKAFKILWFVLVGTQW